ncbi:MAG: serine hydrolase, partial [Mycolicibacterium aromaticivorans]|nr:serine hydrolase [Mycolicibacterium aromaticivorans]
MTAMAARAAIVALVAALTACSGTASKPESRPSLSDQPPPLVPAMALPDNAVDNAVAKLDGIAADLMKSA